MDAREYVWVGESFFNNDKWQIKLLSEFLCNSHSTFYKWLTEKIITHRFLKIHKWIWGDLYEWCKFIQPWQVMDNIIEWIFMQFTFNILWVTLTQKIITCRASKIHKWMQGNMYEWGKVSLTMTSDR